jgi:hypothetical protein
MIMTTKMITILEVGEQIAVDGMLMMTWTMRTIAEGEGHRAGAATDAAVAAGVLVPRLARETETGAEAVATKTSTSQLYLYETNTKIP